VPFVEPGVAAHAGDATKPAETSKAKAARKEDTRKVTSQRIPIPGYSLDLNGAKQMAAM
jgi:hypothetical protein